MTPSWRVLVLTVFEPPRLQPLLGLIRGQGHQVVAVVTLPPYELEEFTRLLPEVNLLVPSDKDSLIRLFQAFEPDLMICFAFPWIIPAEALAIPRLGAINCHAALLPRYRGPLPIEWALRSGDPEIGITFHYMDEQLDHGPVLAQAGVPLEEGDDRASLRAKLNPLVDELLKLSLQRIADGDRGTPQVEEDATWAGAFEEEFVYIDWTQPAWVIHNQIRSWEGMEEADTVGGIVGPLAHWDGHTRRVLRAQLAPQLAFASPPGTILETKAGWLAQCGDGPILITKSMIVS